MPMTILRAVDREMIRDRAVVVCRHTEVAEPSLERLKQGMRSVMVVFLPHSHGAQAAEIQEMICHHTLPIELSDTQTAMADVPLTIQAVMGPSRGGLHKDLNPGDLSRIRTMAGLTQSKQHPIRPLDRVAADETLRVPRAELSPLLPGLLDPTIDQLPPKVTGLYQMIGHHRQGLPRVAADGHWTLTLGPRPRLIHPYISLVQVAQVFTRIDEDMHHSQRAGTRQRHTISTHHRILTLIGDEV